MTTETRTAKQRTSTTTTKASPSQQQHHHQYEHQQEPVAIQKKSNNKPSATLHVQNNATPHTLLSPYERDVIWAYQQALTSSVFMRAYGYDQAEREGSGPLATFPLIQVYPIEPDLTTNPNYFTPFYLSFRRIPLMRTDPNLPPWKNIFNSNFISMCPSFVCLCFVFRSQILFQSLRTLKHHLVEQRQRHQQTQLHAKQKQKPQQGDDGDDDENQHARTLDEHDPLSSNQQITAIEHCTVAIETLLLQDNLPAVVSSLAHFQEWLLKPREEVYDDPYENMVTDDGL